jgi:hypothetical protein
MAQYLFSRSSDGSSGKSRGSYFIIGRVKSIVLGPMNYDGVVNEEYRNPSDIGKIQYEIMYTNMNISKAESMIQPAYPIFSAIKQFPLISEIVLIVPGPDSDLNDNAENQGYYYFPPYSLWNSINHNAFPNLNEYSDYLKEYYTKPGLSGTNSPSSMPDLPMGKTFQELDNIKQLQLFEGDTVIESRFGQSIRFGSTVATSKTLNTWSKSGDPGSPITIIRNGQGSIINPDKFSMIVEDINRDDASIWLTSDQEIHIDNIERFPLRSFKRNYEGSIAKENVITTETYKNTSYSKSRVEQDQTSLS